MLGAENFVDMHCASTRGEREIGSGEQVSSQGTAPVVDLTERVQSVLKLMSSAHRHIKAKEREIRDQDMRIRTLEREWR